MSLPFLKKRNEVSAAPIETKERKPDAEPEYDALESAAEELCSAIQSKDYKSIASALRAAFELLDSEPHFEGPHLKD